MKRRISALLALVLVLGLILPVVAQAAATRRLYFGSLKSTYTLKPGKTIKESAHIYSKVMDNNWRSHAAKIKYQKWNGSKWKTISTIRPSRWGWFNFKASSTGSYRLYYQGCKHFKTKIFKFKVNKPVAPPVIKPPVTPPVVPVVPEPPVVPPVVKVDPQIVVTAVANSDLVFAKATSVLPATKFTGAKVSLKVQYTFDGTEWEDMSPFGTTEMVAEGGGSKSSINIGGTISALPSYASIKQFRAVGSWPGNLYTYSNGSLVSAPIDNPHYVNQTDAGFSITMKKITGAGISAVNLDNWVEAFIDVSHTASDGLLAGGRLDLEYQGYNQSSSTWTTIGSREMSGIYDIDDLEKELYAADASSKRFIKLRVKATWTGTSGTIANIYYSNEMDIPWAQKPQMSGYFNWISAGLDSYDFLCYGSVFTAPADLGSASAQFRIEGWDGTSYTDLGDAYTKTVAPTITPSATSFSEIMISVPASVLKPYSQIRMVFVYPESTNYAAAKIYSNNAIIERPQVSAFASSGSLVAEPGFYRCYSAFRSSNDFSTFTESAVIKVLRSDASATVWEDTGYKITAPAQNLSGKGVFEDLNVLVPYSALEGASYIRYEFTYPATEFFSTTSKYSSDYAIPDNLLPDR